MKTIRWGLTASGLAAACAAFAGPPAYKIVDRIAIAGEARWDLVYVDSAQHRLYLSHGTQTEVIDTLTDQLLGAVTPTPGVHAIAVADELGMGFASDGAANAVTVFDLATLKPRATIAVGSNPDALVYVPASQRLLSFNGKSNDATFIDVKRASVIATLPLGGKPELAVLGKDGKVYVHIADRNEVAVLDPQTAELKQRFALRACEDPSGLAIDPDQRLYSVCDNHLMVVTSSDGQWLGQAPIGEHPDGVVWLDGHAYSSNGGDGTISVVGAADSGAYANVATIATELGARTLGVDAATHRLYLPTAAFTLSPQGKRQWVAGTLHILVLAPQ